MPLTKATQAVIAPNICTTDTEQTITGEKTFTQAITGDLTGNVTGDLTGNVTATSVSTTNLVNGSSLCFRNKIINGNFDIWQRGTSLTSGTGDRFLADRFLTGSAGSTNTVSQQLFPVGQTNVPNNPDFFHRTVVSSVNGIGNYCVLVQRIENVKTLADEVATLSFYAKADSAKPISVEFVQGFGSGGTPSANIEGIGVQKLNLTTSWQKFTITANIPSIAGKTIGTNNNNCFVVNFWFDAGSDFNARTNSLGQQSGTFDIAQVQLEEGSVATPFEVRPIGTELALCQRYYYASSGISLISYGFDITNGSNIAVYFPITMRAIPTCTVSNDTVGVITTTILGSGLTNARHLTIGATRSGNQQIYGVASITASAEI